MILAANEVAKFIRPRSFKLNMPLNIRAMKVGIGFDGCNVDFYKHSGIRQNIV